MDADLVLVGGGLANCLIAYRLSQSQPELKTLLVERGSRLGGEHTWSFNATDLTATQHGWMAPFVEYRWPGYEVRFPPYRRWIDSGYCTITSPRLHELVSETLKERVLTDCDVDSLAPNGVITSDGRSITAAAVIDGRGPVTSPHLVVRFQKFVGQVLRLDRPHGLSGPILMDATVEQRDGYRFLYVLPFTDTTALIEDTRYSDSPVLERDDYAGEIQRYAEAQGWQPAAVVQEEQGVLPVALSGDIERFWENGHGDVARSGLRAALFHPTTGYSLPNAVRLADRLSESLPLSPSDLFDAVMRQSIDHWRETGLFRMLNRMLYLAAEPSQRLKVFQRFYGLPKPLIERFYAGALTNMDRFRLLVGQPPVPLGRAVSAVFSSGRQGSDPVNRAM